jgi:hypothetical protein
MYASYSLQETSPCIDAIPDTAADAAEVDFLSTRRPKDGNGDEVFGYDMGAFEYPFLRFPFTLPGGTGQAEDYRIFTVPVRLGAETGADLLAALVAVLGPYDPYQWRGFAYDGVDYVEFDDPAFAGMTVLPGDAFWIICTSTDVVEFEGLMWSDAAVYDITLEPGWNLVGLPWIDRNIEVRWIAVTDGADTFWISSPDNDLTGQELWHYTGVGPYGGYESVGGNVEDELEVGVGYWIENLTGGTLTMLVPPENGEGFFDARSSAGAGDGEYMSTREADITDRHPHVHRSFPPRPPGS